MSTLAILISACSASNLVAFGQFGIRARTGDMNPVDGL
jgi:hypothetical protein